MEKSRGAIPAWIMPLYRVAESVYPRSSSYDVVIIDEASQSGPEALLLLYLAPKVIVVGDDRQISPRSVGINRGNVNELRRKYLADIPYNDALGLDNSFFDYASIRFGGKIRLREHFRCVPEIIQFSNNLAYEADPLIPLRQFGADRLTPAIMTIYVEHGYQKGKSPRIENQPEAEAVASSIEKCCEDPRYEGKSMGVISLLGALQAPLIEQLLLKSIGPEEIGRRGLVCGNAYAFQGDERDIMFLSMVSAPAEGVVIQPFTTDKDLQRFNVAASRARDQMWLFHSALPGDLNPQDLRYKLLEYCLNPSVEPVPFGDTDIDTLRRYAQRANRQVEEPPDPYESWFEVDVFLKIVDKGFRVIPQYEVMGRRIDLVVEGMMGRMAVECDGDTWHGAEHYDADMARQRELERSGWIFWRVRASQFYRNADDALESLWEVLGELGIESSAHKLHARISQEMKGETAPPDSEIAEEKSEALALEDTSRSHDFSETNSPPVSPSQLPMVPPFLPIQLSIPGAGDSSETKVDNAEEEWLFEVSAKQDDSLPRKEALLVPYRRWPPRPLPDPIAAPRNEIRAGLVEIVQAEGPIIAYRSYEIYADAAGIHKLEKPITRLFNSALYSALREGFILESQEDADRRVGLRVIRTAGSPAVWLRERGDRTLHEVPYSEIGKLMESLRSASPAMSEEDLFQAVLEVYEIEQMTKNILGRLQIASDQFSRQR